MNNVNWDDNAKAAVAVYDEWMCVKLSGQINEFLESVKSQPQNKTVADAVEWHEQQYGNKDWYYDNCDCIVFNSNVGFTFGISSGSRVGDGYIVCTRSGFEAYVKEQDDTVGKIIMNHIERKYEKWTHITNSGYKCRIYVKEPDANGVIIVLTSDGEYKRHDLKTLKPIKPKLTKAQAWDMISSTESFECEVMSKVKEIKEKHDIVEVAE